MVSYKWMMAIGVFALLVCACQGVPINTEYTPAPTETRTQSPVPTQIPSKTAAPSATITIELSRTATQEATVSPSGGTEERIIGGSIIEIEAEDGLSLVGTFYAPDGQSSPAPGVILLHMLWSDRSSWENFAMQLHEAGYAVLAMDFRGHGETGGDVDWDKAVADVQSTWDYLEEIQAVDNERRAIVGASIGANVALSAAALEPAVRTVVLLSPGGDYAGVKTHNPMIAYGERSVLIAASEQDSYAADSSLRLEGLAAGKAELIMYPGSGHGTIMLEREPDLPDLIISWLDDYLQ